jgi:hypothetical protein
MSNEPNTELPIYWPKHWPERWKPRSSDNCKTCGMMLSDKDKLRYDEVYNKWTDSPPTWLGTDDPGKHIDNDCEACYFKRCEAFSRSQRPQPWPTASQINKAIHGSCVLLCLVL